jgi:hypothetical protein
VIIKTCKTCGVEKSLAEFHRNKANKDGHEIHCKVCRLAKSKAASELFKQNDPEGYKEFLKEKYAKSTDGKRRAISKELRKNDPDRLARKKEWWANWYKKNYAKNAERLREKNRLAYQKHREKRLAEAKNYHRTYYPSNRHLFVARNRDYFAKKRNATPAWANKFFMQQAYELARIRTQELGFEWEVDHIIPLRSKTVCGLHVEHNLQVIPKVTNRKKLNRYSQDAGVGIGV